MKKTFLLLVFLLAGHQGLPAQAQGRGPSEAPPKKGSSKKGPPAVRGIATLSFAAGVPQREFANSLDHPGFGGTLFVGAGFREAPVVLGMSLDGLVYGYERRSEPLSNTIPDAEVDVSTLNSIFGAHAVARLQPSTGPVRPYIGGLAGLTLFETNTSVHGGGYSGYNDYGDNTISSTNFDDVAFSYGVSGGFDVVVYRAEGDQLSLNLGARYLFGGEATYLQEGSIERRGGRATYDVDRSRTDLLLPQLGVTATF